jgi:hypothetical protein
MGEYYFAGGMYYNKNSTDLVFNAVRPTGGLPYVTKNKKGLSLTSHHSSLYSLSEDLTEAYLIDSRSGGVSVSPAHIKLSKELQIEFKQVIDKDFFYD